MKFSYIAVGDNTHEVRVANLKDSVGVPQLDATVAMVAVVDEQDVPVAGVIVPLALDHQGSALYRGILPAGGAFVKGSIYKATIKATSANGLKGEWVETLVARVRAA